MSGSDASSADLSVVGSGRAGRRVSQTVWLLAATAGVISVLVAVVVPALGPLATRVHTDRASITWLVTAYLVVAGVATPLCGRIGDLLGKRRVLLVVLILVAMGGALATAVPTVDGLIVGRALQGLGGAVIPLAFGLLRDVVSPGSLAGAVGCVSALVALGGGVGQLSAGTLVDTFGATSVFWVPSAAVLGAAIVCAVLLPDSDTPRFGSVPWWPAVLMSVWLGCLVLGITRGPAWGWASGRVLGLLSVSLVAFVWWLGVERRAVAPLVDVRVLRLPVVWRTNAVALLLGMSMYSLFAFLPQYVQAPSSLGYGWGASVTWSGAMVAPATGMMFVGGLLSGPLTQWLGPRWVLVSGSAVAVPAYVVVALESGSLWVLAVVTAVIGLGVGLVFATTASVVVGVVPVHQSGMASGMTANVRVIGGAVGVAACTSLLASYGMVDGLPTGMGYRVVFLTLAGASCVAVLASASLSGGRADES